MSEWAIYFNGLLDSFLLVVDSALFILALLVQRIIYPSFTRIEHKAFKEWHNIYTTRIGQIVAPLMGFQLFSGAYLLWLNTSDPFIWARFVLILFTWLDTFSRAVPLHQRLQMAEGADQHIALSSALIRINFPRTAVWGLILLLQLWTINA
jgi:hypothetical protein